MTACDSYTWNGSTYTASGVYTFATTNAAGCDSTAILNLTINNSNTHTQVHVIHTHGLMETLILLLTTVLHGY